MHKPKVSQEHDDKCFLNRICPDCEKPNDRHAFLLCKDCELKRRKTKT